MCTIEFEWEGFMLKSFPKDPSLCVCVTLRFRGWWLMMSEVEDVKADGGDDVVVAYSRRLGTETKISGERKQQYRSQ